MSTDYHILEIIARGFAKLFPNYGNYFFGKGRKTKKKAVSAQLGTNSAAAIAT